MTRRRMFLAFAAIVLLGGLLGYQVGTRDDPVGDRAAATAAASAHLEALLSYDPGTLGEMPARIDEATTGPFHDEFRRLFEQTVRPRAEAVKARTVAQVVSSAWVEAAPGRVVALLFVNQSTTTERTVGDRIDTVEARVTMEEAGGRWLVAGLDRL